MLSLKVILEKSFIPSELKLELAEYFHILGKPPVFH